MKEQKEESESMQQNNKREQINASSEVNNTVTGTATNDRKIHNTLIYGT